LWGWLILWSISKTCTSRLLQRRLSIFPRRRYIKFLTDLSFSSPCDTLTSASFQGFNFSKLLSSDPASIGSVLLDVDDQQLQPTGIVNHLRHMKDLLSAPIDTLVQDSDEMKHFWKRSSLSSQKFCKSSSGRPDIFPSSGPKWKKLIIGSMHVAHRPPEKPISPKSAYWLMIRRQLWMPRLTPLQAPKELIFWRGSWKISKRESEQSSGLSRTRKTLWPAQSTKQRTWPPS
jgi:hypothetical protein